MHHDDGGEHQILPKTTRAHPTHFIRTFCALSRGSAFLHTLYYVRLLFFTNTTFLREHEALRSLLHYQHLSKAYGVLHGDGVCSHTHRTDDTKRRWGSGGTEETVDFTGARDNTRSVRIVLLYITHVLYCFSPSPRTATSADRRNKRYKGSEWIPRLFSQISNNTPT